MSKNTSTRYCTKLDFGVTYRFGHRTCNSGPFLFKIGSKCAHFWDVLRTGSVASGFKQFFISEKLELQLMVQFFAVRSGSVPVFFWLREPDFQTLISPKLSPYLSPCSHHNPCSQSLHLFCNLCPSVNQKTPTFCEARAQHISWGQVFHPYTIRSTSLSFPHSVPHLPALFPCSVSSSIFCSSDLSIFPCIQCSICTSLTHHLMAISCLSMFMSHYQEGLAL